jgi:D-inositol-3-phosphate glycosyltransferase
MSVENVVSSFPPAVSEPARRIAVVAYHSSPLHEPGSGDAGGMTVYVRALARSLAQRGFRTDIFTRATGGGALVVEISPGVRVISVPAGPRESVDKETQLEFIDDFVSRVVEFAIAQRVRYDIVHSHYWQSGLAAKALADRWSVPLVHSHHTLGKVKNRALAPGDTPEPLIRLSGEADVISAADVLIASTEQECEQLAWLYDAPADRVKRLHPGVDHSTFSPGDRAQARAELGLSSGHAVLLFVGRIQRLKGIDLAIRAMEQLLPALDRPADLLIVGGASGPEGDGEIGRLKDLADALEVSGALRFTGPQPHGRLVDYYRAADVLLVCSYSESFGLTALEAHASGTPVVGTAVGGLSHIVADGTSGFLVGSRDPAEFAARLKTLLADGDLQDNFAKRAYERSLVYSWDSTADAFVELYECLLREAFPEVCTC